MYSYTFNNIFHKNNLYCVTKQKKSIFFSFRILGVPELPKQEFVDGNASDSTLSNCSASSSSSHKTSSQCISVIPRVSYDPQVGDIMKYSTCSNVVKVQELTFVKSSACGVLLNILGGKLQL